MPDYELLQPASRAELHAWLELYHATATGVRLAIGKKGGDATSLTYDEAVEEGLAFGWIDSTARKLDEHRFTVLFTPRRPGSIWAKSNKARVERLAAAGRMAPAGLAVVAAAKADGSWDALDAADDLAMPDDLSAALESEPGALQGWEALSASVRKMALFWIAQAKRAETRARRIVETVSASTQGRPPRG